MEPIAATHVDEITDAHGGAAASALVAACEHAWQAIQTRHPEIPDVVIVVGTGVEHGRLVKHGHWSTGRWVADGRPRGEVLLAGESLDRPPTEVFATLLHEAVHGLNAARRVKDTSRGGRYHNRKFKTTAEELGLSITPMPPYGHAHTTLTSTTEVRYASEIARLADAMRITRNHTPSRTREGHTTRTAAGGKSPVALCGCGRRMRMAPSVLAQGPVTCGLCHDTFTTDPAAARPTESRTAPSTHETSALTATSRRAVTPMQDAALGELARLDRDAESTAALGRVAHWYGQRHAAQPEPLTGANASERDALEHLARTMLILDGTIHAPAVTIGARELAVGEHVVLGRHHDTRDLDERAVPPAGVFGVVTTIDADQGEVRVDFAISGTHRIAIDGPIARSLEYAYTEPAPRHARAERATPRPPVEAGCEPEL
jgi:SprT-like family.